MQPTRVPPSVHLDDLCCFLVQVDDPVERGIAAAKYHELLAVEVGCITHSIMNLLVFERLAPLDAEPAGLERAKTRRDHHSAGDEGRAPGGLQVEASIVAPVQRGHLLAKMEQRTERFDLLHEPVDELLRPTDRERWNVINRLVRIELGALSARVIECVDDVTLDAQQSELECLE